MSEFSPRTPEEVFQNFKGRQAGINKALNDDVVRARASEARAFFFSLSLFPNLRLEFFDLILKMQHTARALTHTRAHIAISVRKVWKYI
jgi:hypothetical protein